MNLKCVCSLLSAGNNSGLILMQLNLLCVRFYSLTVIIVEGFLKLYESAVCIFYSLEFS